ncbi:hypothetical protein JXB02_00725 [Candidatus Woesearchaeota archaeon]|nr:hypothetical protein [Candidatus Woesearchaeota archaeon]
MEEAWRTYRHLPVRWKALIGCFVMSCVILFVMSLHLVAKSQLCTTDTCVLTALDIFIRVSLSLLVACMVAIVYFMFSFFYAQAKREGMRKGDRPPRKRPPKGTLK